MVQAQFRDHGPSLAVVSHHGDGAADLVQRLQKIAAGWVAAAVDLVRAELAAFLQHRHRHLSVHAVIVIPAPAHQQATQCGDAKPHHQRAPLVGHHLQVVARQARLGVDDPLEHLLREINDGTATGFCVRGRFGQAIRLRRGVDEGVAQQSLLVDR
ncbi:hypothetical protein D3C71_1318500 [compost metagenome]